MWDSNKLHIDVNSSSGLSQGTMKWQCRDIYFLYFVVIKFFGTFKAFLMDL